MDYFQYQTKAEPVSTDAETPQLDKWWQPASHPIWDVEPNVHEGFAYLLDPGDFPAEEVDIDWLVQHPEPQPEPILTHEQIKAITEPTLFVVPDFPQWWQQPSEPVRDVERPVNEGGGFFVRDIVAEVAPEFTWYIQASEPVREAPRPVATGDAQNITEPTLFVDPGFTWWIQPSEPQRDVEPLPIEGAAFTEDFAVEVVVDWWIQPSEPVREDPPLVAEGISPNITEPTLFVVPAFPQWWQPASEPVRDVEPVVLEYFVFVGEPNDFAGIGTVDVCFALDQRRVFQLEERKVFALDQRRTFKLERCD